MEQPPGRVNPPAPLRASGASLGTFASIFTGASPFFLSIPISLAAAFDRSMSRPLGVGAAVVNFYLH
jgi:hypothetical protein